MRTRLDRRKLALAALAALGLGAVGAGCVEDSSVTAPAASGVLQVASTASSQATNIPSADLAGWWRFDEGAGTFAGDASLAGNDGALAGSAAFTGDALLGAAVEFTDLDGSVLIPHDPSLEPPTGTIEAWIKIASAQNSDIVMKTTDLLVRSGVPCGCSVFGLRIADDGSASAFVANDDPSTPGNPWRTAESAAGLVTTGEWHHVAMRWDGSTVAIFVDGVLRDSEPYLPIPVRGLSYHNGSALGLGVGTTWAIPGPKEFIGQMDDVRYYRHPRSDAQIMSDYQLGGHGPA